MLGRLDEARTVRERLVDACSRLLGERHAETIEARRRLNEFPAVVTVD
jgi:hypothetical protein